MFLFWFDSTIYRDFLHSVLTFIYLEYRVYKSKEIFKICRK